MIEPEETSKPLNGVIVPMTHLEVWVIRAVMGCVLCGLGWFGLKFEAAVISIAEIKRELEIVKPSEVLQAVHRLDKSTITKDDVQHLRTRLDKIAEVQATQAIAIKHMVDGLWTREEFNSWTRELGLLNPDIELPERR